MNELVGLKRSSVKKRFPRYLESKIQSVALHHLDLKDMGKLRDSFEGQAYFDRIRLALIAEYSFEKILRIEFNWDIRKKKQFKRLSYEIEEMKFLLVPFSSNHHPLIPLKTEIPLVLCYLKPDNNCYVSGLVPSEILKKSIHEIDTIGEKIDLNGTNLFSYTESFLSFSNSKEFIENLNYDYAKQS